jgi:nucleoside-diphosphate-sugar epimerase
MRALITGGTGFIGSRLALRCLADGHSTRVLGQENTAAEGANRRMLEDAGAELVLGSVTSAATVREVVRGVNAVFHLAAAQHEMNVPDRHFWEVNVGGTRNLLSASAEEGVRRFVHGSTIGVYGTPDGPVDETSACRPDNIYGQTKLAGEREALAAAERVPTIVVRIPEVYGPGDQRMLKLFRAVDRKAFVMIGRGRNMHHLIYVEDLVDALMLASEARCAPGEVFVLAGPEPVLTKDLVAAVARQLGRDLRRVHLPLAPLGALATALELGLRPVGIQPPLHRRRLDFFRKSFQISQEKARAVLGFSPRTDLETGIRLTAEWYRQHGHL